MTVSEILSDVSLAQYGVETWASSHDGVRDRIASAAYRAASYLTDPICKAHELFRRLYLVDHLNGESSQIANLVRKLVLSAGIAASVSVGIFTTLPGIALRYCASQIQNTPYDYSIDPQIEKKLPPDRIFSLLSWNICSAHAGYSITDGGVMPGSFRIDRIVDRILEKGADVNCLYEVFDVNTAWYLVEKLKKKGYGHFYFNFGARNIGVTAGIFVASKYRIENPQFTPFSQDLLVGRTKHCAKGIFEFDLMSKGKSFAKIFTTHLQHSEQPAFPTSEEVEGRKKQMVIIATKANAIRDRCVLVTGDLNLDDREFRHSFWKTRFAKKDDFTTHTWGGDGFCATLVGKEISPPLNLDHTMALTGSVRDLQTTIVETGFDGTVFKEAALSDHSGLYSQITVW